MVFGEHYDCIYSAKGSYGRNSEDIKGTFTLEVKHQTCFSDVYSKMRGWDYNDVTYSIYLFKENLPDKNFNLCTRTETKKILRCLQKTVPFSYKFSQAQFTKSIYSREMIDYNVLTVNIKGSYAQHLWITSMLRCFFEWPFNIAAKEACVLQSDIKEVDGLDLEKENWINLYLTIAAQLGSYGLHGVVDFRGKHPKAKTYHEWKQKLASIKGSPKVIDCLREGGGTFSRNIVRVPVCDQETLNKGVQSRASKYVAAYKDKLSWKK